MFNKSLRILPPSMLLLAGIFTGSAVCFAQADVIAKVRSLRADGKKIEALALIESNLIRTPKTLSPADTEFLQMERGLIATEQGQNDIAKEAFSAVIDAHLTLAENASWQLAQIQLQQGDLDGARKTLSAILKMSPSQKMQSSAQFALAKMNMMESKYREARTELIKQEKRMRHEESYPEIIYQLARADRGVGNQTDFCKWVRKLYAHYPDYKEVASWGFELSTDTFADKPTKCSASPDDKKSRISNLQWAGLATKAQAEIDLLKTTDPEESERLMISFLIHDGEIEQALGILKPKFATHKNDPAYLMQIGTASSRLGDMQAAVGSFYSAYKSSPRGKFGKQALYQAAFLSYQFQDYDGAARKFQEFMKIFPGSGLTRDARWHLAWIRYLRGDYDGAYKSLSELQGQVHHSKKAAKFFAPDRVQYWMAMCLYRLNRYAEAREVFSHLADDRLMGFYSIAALGRIHKIDEVMPKQQKHLLPDENMHLSRFSLSSALMPSEDPSWYRDLASQQMPIDANANALADAKPAEAVVSGEDTENEQDLLSSEQGPDRGAVAAEGDDEDHPVTFTSPMLTKRFARAKALTALGLVEWARWDLFDIERNTSNREYLRALMEQYEVIESYNRSSYIGQVTFGMQRAVNGMDGVRKLWEHAFPRAYANQVQKYSKEYNVPSELIWGIMRTESQYKRDVVSPVGALGLMQVMPFTAQKVAGLLGEKDFDAKKLLQPEGAVKIGSKYLQRLLKKFDGNLALVAAGYNAGPHRVKAWVAGFGQLEMDEFIEHIPYLETRNYVKRVLTFYNTYAKLYGAKDFSLNLSDALHFQNKGPIIAKESWEDI